MLFRVRITTSRVNAFIENFEDHWPMDQIKEAIRSTHQVGGGDIYYCSEENDLVHVRRLEPGKIYDFLNFTEFKVGSPAMFLDTVKPFDQFPTPSSTTLSEVSTKREIGKICAYCGFVKFMIAVNSAKIEDPSYLTCAMEAVRCMKTRFPDNSKGFLTGAIQETTLGSILMGIIAKYQAKRVICSDVLVCRDLPDSPAATKRSVDGCYLLDVNGALIPSTVFELTIKDPIESKHVQLFAYATNFDQTLYQHTVPYMIGVVLQFTKHSMVISVVGYYKVLDDRNRAKLASVELIDLEWNAKNFAKVLYAIDQFNYYKLQNLQSWFFEINSNSNIIRLNRQHNVAFTTTSVYKVFDDRMFMTQRKYKNYLKYIPDCQVVVQMTDLIILEYPRITGSHLPDNTKAVLSAMKFLANIHAQQDVHGDIKAGNILFSDQSIIIDFCFSDEVGKARYPLTYNVSIDDGERHPLATPGNVILPEHDIYSFAKILQFSTPVHSPHNLYWTALITDILHTRSLNNAILQLESLPTHFDLKSSKQFLQFQGTGSPPGK